MVPRGGGRRLPVPTTAHAAVGAAAFFVAHALLVLASPDRARVHDLVDLAYPLLGLIYVPLAAVAARRSQGRVRTAWWVMTAAFACWAVGEIIWTYDDLAHGEVPVPSWADVAYLAYVPGVLVALLLFPARGTWRDKGSMVLDGVIMTGSFFLISWLTVTRGFWRTGFGGDIEAAIEMAYRVSDVLILSIGLLVLLRVCAGLRLTMALLVASFLSSAVGTGLWSYAGPDSGFPFGEAADLCYSANSLLAVVALVAACHAQPAPAEDANAPGWLSLWLPLVPLAVAAVCAARAQPGVATEPPVVVTGALLIVATLARQLAESTELVRRERRIRQLADRLGEELTSASRYVASILPDELSGPVRVSSRYLPSRAVGGDCFGYSWVDDDHLIAYLIDVSGHGVRPALLSVSIHNLLRSGALGAETLLHPDRVLAELNTRFSMDNQDGHYFTIWFGVYQLSTGRLSYANAGHPPPVLLSGRDGITVYTLLAGGSLPVGLFPDTTFTVEEVSIGPQTRILLYSDGALGLRSRSDEFAALCAGLPDGPQQWLDTLIEQMPGRTDDDDCSLVELVFTAEASRAGVLRLEPSA